jgi:hypothetical protein
VAIRSALHHGIRLAGSFSLAEMLESSNVHELLATLYSLLRVLPFLGNLHLNHHMDNLGAVQALGGIIEPLFLLYTEQICAGSNTPRIQDLFIQIDDCCIQANIDWRSIWAPRELNTIADYMSKLGTGDIFWVRTCLDSKFGQHTIDRFASRNNVQVSPPPVQFSLFRDYCRMVGCVFLPLDLDP